MKFLQKRSMLHGFKFKSGVLRWIWVLCVAVHITSCEGVLRRDDIRGIEFFPLMSRDRSDDQQNQAIVGKKIDLEEVEKWFNGLLAYVNKYGDELKSIRGTVVDYQGDSGNKLIGLQYEEQRIALPFLKGTSHADLVRIIRGDKYSGLFSGECSATNEGNSLSGNWILQLGFPGYTTDGSDKDTSENITKLRISDSKSWVKPTSSVVSIEIDQTGSGMDLGVQKVLPLWILDYIGNMADKIRSNGNGGNCDHMRQVGQYINSILDIPMGIKGLCDGNKRSDLEKECASFHSIQGSSIFDCDRLVDFVTFGSIDRCIGHAENIAKRIATFSKKLGDQIREKRGKSKKNGRVFMDHGGFQKQYSQDIIGVLTSVKSLFGKTSSPIGSAMLGYEEEISKCFSDIRGIMEWYSQNWLNVLKYMTYSVLHHASKLISGETITPNFEPGVFSRECSCVNIGIINTLNMIHILHVCDKVLEVFLERNVQEYMRSLRERYRTLISIADKVDRLGMTSAKDLTISGMKEILDIKIRPERG